MKYRLCLFVVFFSHFCLTAQEDIEESGKALFSKKNYVEALPIYKKLFEQEPDNIEYNYNLAVCYLNTYTKREDAISHLEYISRKKSKDAEIWYYLGLSYQYVNRFDDAISAYEKAKLIGSDKLITNIERQIETCYNGKQLVKYPLNISFQNLGKFINSKYPDYYPLIPDDASFLLFTSRRPGNVGNLKEIDGYYSSDIYISFPKEGHWTTAKGLSVQINTAYDEKAVDLSGDGKKLVVYLDRIDSMGNIYYAENTKSGFQKIVKFNGEINSYFETSGSLSQDGETFVFASKRPEGSGGTDIYIARKLPNGLWGIPQKIGNNINTKYNEDFPHLSSDGKTLYFSSEGHSSMGGFDIFKSIWKQDQNTWSAPQNIGYPINNSYDNMNITFARDSSQAYLSTVREDGMGDLDIYKINFNDIDKKYCVISGYVTSSDQINTEIKSTIIATRSDSKEILKFVPIKRSGKYIMVLQPGTYNITITTDEYKDISYPLTIYELPFQPEITKDFILARTSVPK